MKAPETQTTETGTPDAGSSDVERRVLPRIEAAAIRHPSGRVFSVPRPGRHHDVIRVMGEAGEDARMTTGCVQGFLDSKGRFLTRTAAVSVAVRAGQIERPKWGKQLYSEDVW